MAIITISRGTMSGGQMLADMLAKKLGYRCLSREIIIKAADDYGVEEYKLFEAIRKSPTILQKLTFDRERYLAFIQASLCEYAKDDNLIYHGHAGHILLKGISHVLRFRILAGMPFRLKAAMERHKFTEEEARKYIEQVDKERIKWTKFLYGKDWTSAELYDLVVNLDNADLDFACDLVMCAIKQPAFQTTTDSKKMMNDLLIFSRIRAALAQIPQIRLGSLDIKADNGEIILQGKCKSAKILDTILEITTNVPGVTQVINKLNVDYRNFPVE